MKKEKLLSLQEVEDIIKSFDNSVVINDDIIIDICDNFLEKNDHYIVKSILFGIKKLYKIRKRTIIKIYAIYNACYAHFTSRKGNYQSSNFVPLVY